MYGHSAPRARNVIADLAARGQYHFNSAELRLALGVSGEAARQALSRLAARGEIASPGRGFYVIVPPEYRRLGCLPAANADDAPRSKDWRLYVNADVETEA